MKLQRLKTPLTASALALFTAATLDAAGGSSTPTTTPTTTECKKGEVYDEKTGKCLESSSQLLDDDTRYAAVRELAYAGKYDRALMVIANSDAPDAARMLNYRGFIARKQGDMKTAMTFYTAALKADPDLLLARSYMGQGLAAQGDKKAARAQLKEIAARGGKDSWEYEALELALAGSYSDY